jgi:plasmid segregation protein ParM
MMDEPHRCLVGDDAVQQSRHVTRREDRGWFESDEWYTLALAALTEVTSATRADVTLVTGLPVSFYDDKDRVAAKLRGIHRAKRDDRAGQQFTITDLRVIPQPFGALLSLALDNHGKIVDVDLATSTVGVIDIGGKTTNLLSVEHLSEIRHATDGVNVGAWSVVRALRDWLAREYPDLDLRDHQIAQVVQKRRLAYYGEAVEIGDVVDELLEPMASQVIAAATQLWNGAAALRAVLVAGGGALLLGPYLRSHFRHARLVDDPVFANAVGFWKFAERVGNAR